MIKYIKKLVMAFSLKNTLVGQNPVETSQEQPQQQPQVQQQPQPQPQSLPQQPNIELELVFLPILQVTTLRLILR